ncbi:MAG TPA: tetratricopeptide repeat protein [Bryobacteraceae bacterium]|nr:tetratricopeptide repeat protein [Bryobacteraceae bacterium]
MRLGIALTVLAAMLQVSCTSGAEKAQRHIQEAKALLKAGQADEAAKRFQAAIAADARAGDAYYGLAAIQWNRPWTDSLEKNLARAVELQPNNKDAHEKLSELYLQYFQGETKGLRRRDRLRLFTEQMAVAARSLLKIDPQSVQGHKVLGIAEDANRNYDAAIHHLRIAFQGQPDSDAIAASLFKALVAAKRGDEADDLAMSFTSRVRNPDALWLAAVRHYKSTGGHAKTQKATQNVLQLNPDHIWANLEFVWLYHSTGRPQEAEKLAQTLVNSPERFPEGLTLVTEFYIETGQYEKAATTLKYAEARFPTRVTELRLRRARLLRESERPREARLIVDELLKERSDLADAKVLHYALLADARTAYDTGAAIRELQALREQQPTSVNVVRELGRAQFAAGLLTDAADTLQEGLRLEPRSVPVRTALVDVYVEDGYPLLALSTALQGLSEQPENSALLFARAKALAALQRYEEAKSVLQTLTGRRQASLDTEVLMAEIEIAQGQLESASGRLSRVGSASTARVAEVRARLHGARGEHEAARQVLAEAIGRGFNDRPMVMKYAAAASAAGKHDEALRAAQQIAAKLKNATTSILLADVLQAKGDVRSALNHARQALKASPRDENIRLRIAELMQLNGEDAKQAYEAALAGRPDDPKVAIRVAELSLGSDPGVTTSLLQRAVRKGNNDPDVLRRAARVYTKLGNPIEAQTLYRLLTATQGASTSDRVEYATSLLATGDRLAARREIDLALQRDPGARDSSSIRKLMASF